MICNKYVIKSDIQFLFWHFDALDFRKQLYSYHTW